MHWIVSSGILDHWAFLEREQQAIDDPVRVVPADDLDAAHHLIRRLESERDQYREGWLSRGRDINRMSDILCNPPQSLADLIERMERRHPETVIARAVCGHILTIHEGSINGS